MKITGALFVLSICLSCDSQTNTIGSHDESNWKQKVDSIMTLQEDAWNRGDLDVFMQAYWHSDSLIFIGKRGLSYGWETTLNSYRKGYPDKKAMGTLEFGNLEYKRTGPEHSLVIGRWNLYRSEDTLRGSYSLTWQLINGEWKIIADHSS